MYSAILLLSYYLSKDLSCINVDLDVHGFSFEVMNPGNKTMITPGDKVRHFLRGPTKPLEVQISLVSNLKNSTLIFDLPSIRTSQARTLENNLAKSWRGEFQGPKAAANNMPICSRILYCTPFPKRAARKDCLDHASAIVTIRAAVGLKR
jgi:hypothetical protein